MSNKLSYGLINYDLDYEQPVSSFSFQSPERKAPEPKVHVWANVTLEGLNGYLWNQFSKKMKPWKFGNQ